MTVIRQLGTEPWLVQPTGKSTRAGHPIEVPVRRLLVGEKLWFGGDTAVVMVKPSETEGIVYVKYAQKDNFGERAIFAADLVELTVRSDG